MIVISTGTQWSGEIYLETELASLSIAWFSATLHFATIDKSIIKPSLRGGTTKQSFMLAIIAKQIASSAEKAFSQ